MVCNFHYKESKVKEDLGKVRPLNVTDLVLKKKMALAAADSEEDAESGGTKFHKHPQKNKKNKGFNF